MKWFVCVAVYPVPKTRLAAWVSMHCILHYAYGDVGNSDYTMTVNCLISTR